MTPADPADTARIAGLLAAPKLERAYELTSRLGGAVSVWLFLELNVAIKELEYTADRLIRQYFIKGSSNSAAHIFQ